MLRKTYEMLLWMDLTALIIPVKRLMYSKLRMSHFLSCDERKTLVLTMLSDVLKALKKINSVNKYVIGVDSEVEDLAHQFSFTFLKDDDVGLNRAISACINRLSQSNEDSLLILPADIPLVETNDIALLLRFKDKFDIVICPSKDAKGTNALLLKFSHLIQPQFGDNSFQKHIAEASSKNLKIKIIKNRRIGQDIDTINDLIDTQTSMEINTRKFLFEKNILNRL